MAHSCELAGWRYGAYVHELQGATHVLVLRSRRPLAGNPAVPRPQRSARWLTRTTLRKESAELRTALLTRTARNAADAARIAELEAEGRALMVYPPESVPPVSRLTTDGALLSGAFESGRSAILALLPLATASQEEFPTESVPDN